MENLAVRGDASNAGTSTDEELVLRVIEGHVPAFTWLMRRYNRRLFRVIRGVLREDAEAEDACQEAWLRAYTHLATLQRGASFGTWVCRIGLRCALERIPRARIRVSLDELDRLIIPPRTHEPERWVEQRRLADEIEQAIDRLVPAQRTVVLLRDVEQLTTGEVAAVLGLSEENVRVRLHRAHARLREDLGDAFDQELLAAFPFGGERCDRLVGVVVRRLYAVSGSAGGASTVSRQVALSGPRSTSPPCGKARAPAVVATASTGTRPDPSAGRR